MIDMSIVVVMVMTTIILSLVGVGLQFGFLVSVYRMEATNSTARTVTISRFSVMGFLPMWQILCTIL